MKICPKCGREVDDSAKFCTFCGATLVDSSQPEVEPQPTVNQPQPQQNATPNYNNSTSSVSNSSAIGWGILGFFIPLAGLILFCVWLKSEPAKAKAAGIGALIGFVLSIVWSVIYTILILPSITNAIAFF